MIHDFLKVKTKQIIPKCWINWNNNIVTSFSASFCLLCVLYLFFIFYFFCNYIINTCKYYHWKTIILKVLLWFFVVEAISCVIHMWFNPAVCFPQVTLLWLSFELPKTELNKVECIWRVFVFVTFVVQMSLFHSEPLGFSFCWWWTASTVCFSSLCFHGLRGEWKAALKLGAFDQKGRRCPYHFLQERSWIVFGF